MRLFYVNIYRRLFPAAQVKGNKEVKRVETSQCLYRVHEGRGFTTGHGAKEVKVTECNCDIATGSDRIVNRNEE